MPRSAPAKSKLDLVQVEQRGAIAIVRLCRPAKRNALSDALMAALAKCLSELPDTTRAIVLHGEGDHFSAGLDLAELKERDAEQGLQHSRSWHPILQGVEFGRAPVIAALHGAVVGGGLELACACHIRVADESARLASRRHPSLLTAR